MNGSERPAEGAGTAVQQVAAGPALPFDVEAAARALFNSQQRHLQNAGSPVVAWGWDDLVQQQRDARLNAVRDFLTSLGEYVVVGPDDVLVIKLHDADPSLLNAFVDRTPRALHGRLVVADADVDTEVLDCAIPKLLASALAQ